MKSPWKFIGNLISRGRPAGADNGQDAEHAEAQARAEPAQEDTLPVTEVPPEPPAEDVSPIRKPAEDEARAPERSARARSKARTAPKRHEAVKEVATRRKRVGRAKKASIDTVDAPDNQATSAPSTQDHFQTEVENVDADIQRLRRQLADVLVLQNAQLKKMLERFGVS
ncbi:hypothetical protein GB927_021175 [Shinella sp. CPCC 100929]|uniref:Uncharacterized protein n=1 Tax=Shinella lacus TaxID=2654216 RepID=A0ABT1RBV3_9HYPH|nr:hypothetical protein [Shinella lacus]MCQ4632569.1 hypothetical protein [Shinella lacus]